ncbi:MAG: acetyl-CoA carboxylase biotin carboxyl carrier protein subunit, partial [Steroidobacteraceae bacterium]
VEEFPKTRSPWTAIDGFRLVGTAKRRITLEFREERREVLVEYHAKGWRITFDSADVHELRACRGADHRLAMWIDGASHYAHAMLHEGLAHVLIEGEQASIRIVDPRVADTTREIPNGGLRSPMPGKVVAVHVKAGDRVKRGAALLAIEAMKMEHVLTAPTDGTIERLHVTEGAQVAEAVALVDFKAD